MRWKTALTATVMALFVGVATSAAQQQTGEIFGRVVDTSGAVLPGVTVTVAGPSLIQPRVVTTSETGTYRVPELPIGTYAVTFELPGFRTMVMQDIRRHDRIPRAGERELQVSAVQETVTVTGESPLIDTRETGTKTQFRSRDAAEPAVGARSVGDARARARHHDGPRQRRRHAVGPAVQLRLARREHRQQQVVDRRRRHHRHVGDRLVADLLRLRHARRDAGHHRRRRRRAADRRRRHQPRHAERNRSLQGLGPLLLSPTRSSRPTTSTTI